MGPLSKQPVITSEKIVAKLELRKQTLFSHFFPKKRRANTERNNHGKQQVASESKKKFVSFVRSSTVSIGDEVRRDSVVSDDP